MRFVDNSHDVKILLGFIMARVSLFLLLTINAAPIDFGKLALPLYRYLPVIEGNESDAVRRGQRFRQIFF
jgi:hypothetical protein